MALIDYRSSLSVDVNKDISTGKYSINTSVYSFANKVKEEFIEYDIDDQDQSQSLPDDPAQDPDNIVGVITSAYYGQTVGQIVYPNARYVSSIHDIVGEGISQIQVKNTPYGYSYLCANMGQLEQADFSRDFNTPIFYDEPYNGYDPEYEAQSPIRRNEYAFYMCSNLTNVDVNTKLDVDDCCMWKMFYKCISLSSVTGVVQIDRPEWCKDMFYGCVSLTGLQIRDPNGLLMEKNSNNEYWYEYIGLQSADQFTIVS